MSEEKTFFYFSLKTRSNQEFMPLTGALQ